PLGGILFLGWSAPNVLVLYFVDTMLAMTVLFAGLARYFSQQTTESDAASRINSETGVVVAALFLTAFMAIPLGMPVFFMLAASHVTLSSMFADQGFRVGLVLQAIAAFWSCAGLYRALKTQTPEQLRLKRRFALVFLRWIAVLMVAYTGIVWLFGRF